MGPQNKLVVRCKEVRQGRSLNPDGFAMVLGQVVAGTAGVECGDARQRFAGTNSRPPV